MRIKKAKREKDRKKKETEKIFPPRQTPNHGKPIQI